MRRILAASAVAVLSVTLAGPALADHKPKHAPPERPVAAPPQDRPPAVTPPSGVQTPRTPVQGPPPVITSVYGVDNNGSGAFDATYDEYLGTNDGLPDYLRVTFSEPVLEPGVDFTNNVAFTAQLAVVDDNGRSLSEVGDWYFSFYPYNPSPWPLAPNEAVILPMYDDGSGNGFTYYPPGSLDWYGDPLYDDPTFSHSTGPVFPLTVTGVSGVTDLDGNPVDLAGSDIVIKAQAPTP